MNMKSVVDHLQAMYGYTIKYSHLPCLQVASQKKACKIVGGRGYTKGLNEKQITSLLKVSCQRPREQETDILQTIQQNDYEYNPYAKEFVISEDSKLTSVDARVLPAPWLKYHKHWKRERVLATSWSVEYDEQESYKWKHCNYKILGMYQFLKKPPRKYSSSILLEVISDLPNLWHGGPLLYPCVQGWPF